MRGLPIFMVQKAAYAINRLKNVFAGQVRFDFTGWEEMFVV